MLELAAVAKKRGDVAAALDWYEQAYRTAQGPATRLQWGASYVDALVELAPVDGQRIEGALDSLVDGLDPSPDTFFTRNRMMLERIGTRLTAWNHFHQHDAVLARVQARMDGVCKQLPEAAPERASCAGAFRTAGSAPHA